MRTGVLIRVHAIANEAGNPLRKERPFSPPDSPLRPERQIWQ